MEHFKKVARGMITDRLTIERAPMFNAYAVGMLSLQWWTLKNSKLASFWTFYKHMISSEIF